MKRRPPEQTPCPCGNGVYTECCGPAHAGVTAPTAEILMRSRYSAYVLKLESYLLETWHASTRPVSLDLAEDPAQWLGLDVKLHAPAGDEAIVEFVARFRINGRAHRLHETSRFVRESGRWYYVDGKIA